MTTLPWELQPELLFDMKPEKLFLELEEITEKLGYKVRKERGNFRGGYCVIEGEKLIMLNKNHSPETMVNLLAMFLKTQDAVHDLYLKPAVRKEMSEIWKAKAPKRERKNPLITENGEA